MAVENPSADTFSFSFEETAQREEAGVGSVTIDNIVNGHANAALFILKLDAEGAENEIFNAPGQWRQFAPTLMIEPHDWPCAGRQSLRGVSTKAGKSRGKDANIFFLPEPAVKRAYTFSVRGKGEADPTPDRPVRRPAHSRHDVLRCHGRTEPLNIGDQAAPSLGSGSI